MSISKTVQKTIFLAIMAISAILLCFVGVWASQTAINLKFTGIVNPDIICKIEAKATSAETYTTLFDNSGSDTAQDYFDNQNRLKNFTTTLDGTVATGLDFKLTNYTPTKHIRLSVQNILIDGETFTLENLMASHTSISAEKMEATANSAEFTLSLSANKIGEFTVNLSLLVEEVYMVSTSGEGLGNPGKFFFAEDEAPEIPLLASVSYQLPQNIVFNKLIGSTLTPFTENTTYSRTINTQGTATFNSADLFENVSIVCNCDRVFLVEKTSNPSLFENGQATAQGFVATYDSSKIYIPNNGKYTYSQDFTQVTKADGYAEYPFYVTLGEYPQTKVSDDMAITLDEKLSSGQLTLKAEYTQNIKSSSAGIAWYELDGEKYVKTKSVVYGGETTNTAWFKVEPISWVVLEAQNPSGQTISLDTLYYDETNKMLYQDQLRGKPFVGKLVLISAYTLDTIEFNPAGLTYANFSGSQLQTLLRNSIGSAYTLNGNATLADMQSNYSQLTNLNTYIQNESGFSITNINSALFAIAGANINEQDPDSNENYHASTYFSGAPETNTNILTTTLAVTSPTDYAIAHYAETSNSESTSTNAEAYNNPTNSASPRGWAIGIAPTTNTTCTYWTRSAHYSSSPFTTMAKVVNTRGAIRATNITDPHITVRPCMVLDIGFYYSGTFEYYS